MAASRSGIVSISIFGALLLPGSCLGQRSTFKQFGQAEGLSNLNVNVLLQTRAGLLWAATENGLFRYDGLRFERVSLGPDGLVGNILALHEDAAGRLWVGRQDGVGYLEGGAFHIVRFQGGKLPLLAGSTISSSSSDGTVFIASDGDLLAGNRSPSSGEWSFRKIPMPDPAHPGSPLKAHSVLAGPDGSLIAGCGEGICRLQGFSFPKVGRQRGLTER
jgi:ligand-binding sensor domain-containing protein